MVNGEWCFDSFINSTFYILNFTFTFETHSTARLIIGLPKIAAQRDFWEEEEPPCKSSVLPFGKMLTA